MDKPKISGVAASASARAWDRAIHGDPRDYEALLATAKANGEAAARLAAAGATVKEFRAALRGCQHGSAAIGACGRPVVPGTIRCELHPEQVPEAKE